MNKLIKIMITILVIMMFSGCGASKLSSDFSEEKLKTAVEAVVNNLNNEKYDDIIKTGNQDIKDNLTAEKLKESWIKMKNKLGKFDSITKEVFAEKDGSAIVIVVAKYEKGEAQFTISYNKSMDMIGIYMK